MTWKGSKAEWLFVLLVAILAGIAWFGTSGLPIPRWEPIGPAALPRALAVLLLCLLVGMVAEIMLKEAAPPKRDEYQTRPGYAAAVVMITIAGVALMASRVVGFRAAAFLIFAGCGLVLSGFSRSRRLSVLLTGIALALGLHALFVYVFVTNLP